MISFKKLNKVFKLDDCFKRFKNGLGKKICFNLFFFIFNLDPFLQYEDFRKQYINYILFAAAFIQGMLIKRQNSMFLFEKWMYMQFATCAPTFMKNISQRNKQKSIRNKNGTFRLSFSYLER